MRFSLLFSQRFKTIHENRDDGDMSALFLLYLGALNKIPFHIQQKAVMSYLSIYTWIYTGIRGLLRELYSSWDQWPNHPPSLERSSCWVAVILGLMTSLFVIILIQCICFQLESYFCGPLTNSRPIVLHKKDPKNGGLFWSLIIETPPLPPLSQPINGLVSTSINL